MLNTHLIDLFMFPILKAIGAAIEVNGNVSFTNNNAKGFEWWSLVYVNIQSNYTEPWSTSWICQ